MRSKDNKPQPEMQMEMRPKHKNKDEEERLRAIRKVIKEHREALRAVPDK